METKKQIHTIDTGLIDSWDLAVHPIEPILAVGSHIGNIISYNIETGKEISKWETRQQFLLKVVFVSILFFCLFLFFSFLLFFFLFIWF